MKRAYYSNELRYFINESKQSIFSEIMTNDSSVADELQRNTWKIQIDVLKKALECFNEGYIIFEYTIPRIGKRVDNIFIYKGTVFIIEFKVGESKYPSYAIEQVIDYALDLRCFHKESHGAFLVPILCCTKAFEANNQFGNLDDKMLNAVCCNEDNLALTIKEISGRYTDNSVEASTWMDSAYMPTPTIVEAAQALYSGHNVREISRNDAAAQNLNATTLAINAIIELSKQNNKKSICFVTGVPGAGKTLAGLNISIERERIDKDEHAVFLSGNGPLVEVLKEALVRDDHTRNKVKKSEAERKAKKFIQAIHHFRDEALKSELAPVEKVVIFDEAQRAWTSNMLSKFMSQKRGYVDFDISEPEFLISIMDRHNDWATIVCLIGGGQEINTGEAGLPEWFAALRRRFNNWNVFISDQIKDKEYIRDYSAEKLFCGLNLKIVSELHLGVSLRSFRSENVSAFIKAMLDGNIETAQNLYSEISSDYPIFVTRNINTAKSWIKSKAKGSTRYGIIASSGAKRLRKYGIWVQNKIDAPNWFLNGKNDIRSSYFLEETATEFDIQGLELDWTIVCWDADLRIGHLEGGGYFEFKGTKWQNINSEEKRLYLKNTYRVLLTRARQGFIIFVPEGDLEDETRKPEYYDDIFFYLKSIGIKEI